MKNKKLLIILIVILIVVTAGVLLYPAMKKSYVGKTIPVLKAKEDIGQGMILSEDLFDSDELPVEFIESEKDYATLEDLKGNYAKHIILKNESLMKRKISTPEESALFAEKNLIAVTIDTIAAAVGTKISVSDHVIVRGFLADPETGENIVFSPENLRNVEIAYIVNSEALEQSEEEKDEKFIPKSVVLKVNNEEQAKELIKLEYSSKIHLERLSEQQIKNLENNQPQQPVIMPEQDPSVPAEGSAEEPVN